MNENFVGCQCGNILELVPGQVDMNQKDSNGQPITREAAEHMAKYRIRCSECGKNFCAKCNEEPYH